MNSNLLCFTGFLLVGFLDSYMFSSWLQMKRKQFVLAHSVVSVFYSGLYIYFNQINILQFILRNLKGGLIGALLVGVFLVFNVVSQGRTENETGIELALDIFINGIIYGTVDALVLSILPVLIVINWLPASGNILIIIAGLILSNLVTFTYHIGFKEFRNKSIIRAMIGNTLCTLAFLLTGNMLAPTLSHAAMHIMAVIWGPKNKIQLPPHYPVKRIQENNL